MQDPFEQLNFSEEIKPERWREETIEGQALFNPVTLVECPTCHSAVYPHQLLNSEPDGVCDVCAKMSSHLEIAQVKNTFAAYNAKWFQDTHEVVTCTVFFRPEWKHRVPAFCTEIHQYITNAKYVAVHSDLDCIFTKLQSIGCGATAWQELTRETYHQYIASSDDALLWKNGYSVIKESGIFNPLPEPMSDKDLEDNPF